MKVAILAGGYGTRLAEETTVRPKPMVEIGGHPVLWHIMMHYAHYGYDDFTIALGYQSEYIKQYMLDHYVTEGSLHIDTKERTAVTLDPPQNEWNIHLIETGLKTNTGGRIKRLQPYLNNDTFMLTWGDGVSNVNLDDLLRFHRSHGKLATMTVVQPPPRFGHVKISDTGMVSGFVEKPQARDLWVNGAFFVLEPGIFDYIEGDETQWEKSPMQNLARDGQLMAYHHHSFWQCMDTIHDKALLEKLWKEGNAEWALWKHKKQDDELCVS
ncbi:MAG: glucose-1-phosphate cytidylyltransferase [Waddliaceae bacterium]|nr:glucose-1-phosphate cytidylyltransferase [Waddliaceae bacterium]